MGIYNSSKTRVEPFFDWLFDKDPTGVSWLQSLIQLPVLPGYHRAAPEINNARIESGRAWGNDERPLPAPLSLLEWLISNLRRPEKSSALGSDPVTIEMRDALLRHDSEAVKKALESVRDIPSERAWCIFEGNSKPDAFLQTPDAIIVIEGKRTEAGPTTHTTWMPVRHQMLRHIDAAWDGRGKRNVYGFFMVEAEPGSKYVPQKWLIAALDTISRTSVDESLPHRSPSEREDIAKAFLGVTTWQLACEALNVPVDILPPETNQT